MFHASIKLQKLNQCDFNFGCDLVLINVSQRECSYIARSGSYSNINHLYMCPC